MQAGLAPSRDGPPRPSGRPSRALCQGGRTMDHHSVAYVGFDASKTKHAVAVAESGREGEVRYLGEIETTPAAVERLLRKLACKYKTLHVCYEAGPTGYGLYRRIRALGHVC